MKRFVEGTDRSQSILFPEHLDDYVAEDNIVRIVEPFLTSTCASDKVGTSTTRRSSHKNSGFHTAWGGSSPSLPLGDGRSHRRALAVANENEWRRSMRFGSGEQ